MMIWKAVSGYPGYFVSSTGLVRGLRKELSPFLNSGYWAVDLYLNRKKRRAYVHRLVAEAFHGDPPDGMEAAHRNGNRDINEEGNIYWATRQQNALDRIAHGTHVDQRGILHSQHKLTEMEVFEIRKLTGTHQSIADQYGVARKTISDIVSGRNWKHLIPEAFDSAKI